jgi:hypothetical protein
MKPMASEGKNSSSRSRSSASSRRAQTSSRSKVAVRRLPSPLRFAICIRNDSYAASLELRKLYRVVEDTFGEQHGLIRVVDESGEDYLYPDSYFMQVELPRDVEMALRKIA